MSVPPTVGGRAATLVERESRPFAVLVHDAAVLDQPALRAMPSATRDSDCQLRNTALTEEVAIADRRSRRRQASAQRLADVEERRRLECRMQDGVERRLEQLSSATGSHSEAETTP